MGFPEGLTGFREMNPAWGIDWGRLIDIDVRDYDPAGDKSKRLQFAYRIDTSTVNPLSNLPPSVAVNPSSLPARNLLRGWRLGLPSGQRVAHAMGVKPLHDEQILIGKFVNPLPTSPDPEAPQPITSISSVFARNCPLWTYILAETQAFQESVTLPVNESVTILTPRLGPVGGRIVAEVFLGLMFGDNHSFLNQDPNWQPPQGPGYALKDSSGTPWASNRPEPNEFARGQADSSGPCGGLKAFERPPADSVRKPRREGRRGLRPLPRAGAAVAPFEVEEASAGDWRVMAPTLHVAGFGSLAGRALPFGGHSARSDHPASIARQTARISSTIASGSPESGHRIG